MAISEVYFSKRIFTHIICVYYAQINHFYQMLTSKYTKFCNLRKVEIKILYETNIIAHIIIPRVWRNDTRVEPPRGF